MVRMSDLHLAKASTHYHITGSLTHMDDRHHVILHATEQASFKVKRCDAREIGEHIDGRCDNTDYDPETKRNMMLVLLTKPVASEFTKGVFIDMDYTEILPCSVIPVMCLAIDKLRQ